MALLTVEISEKLLAKLRSTGRPAQEVIVEALEHAFEGEPPPTFQVDPSTETLCEDSANNTLNNFRDKEEAKEDLAYARAQHKKKPLDKDLPREEIERRLLEAGYIRNPTEYDSLVVQEWLALSEEERQQHIKEMNELYFPDSPASTFINESRR